MRHKSITLTMDIYVHLYPGQEADAVACIRDMFVGSSESLRATGTDDCAERTGPEVTRSLPCCPTSVGFGHGRLRTEMKHKVILIQEEYIADEPAK